jgi:hypothetical protein
MGQGLSEVSGERFRKSYIGSLGSLVTAREQDSAVISDAREIDAISGAEVDPELGDTLTDRTAVSWISEQKSPYAHVNADPCEAVVKPIEPGRVIQRLPNFWHTTHCIL